MATTSDGIDGLLRDAPDARIVFDATSAKAHVRHAPQLKQAGVIAIDLTPAARGPYVVPVVNLGAHSTAPNVNLISCGGQATVPIVAAAARVAPVEYAEIVSTIASKSAGPGTRQNIDEFTETTAAGLVSVGGAERGKAIIILNPAEPPILMTNTVHGLIEDADTEAIVKSIEAMVQRIQQYVPGYRLRAKPLIQDQSKMKMVTLFVEVEGAGDFLPKYAGNLDIMTAAAVKVGEEIGRHLNAGGWKKKQAEGTL